MLLKDLPKCPVETTLKMIGRRWKIIILRELLAGTMRFGELKKAVSGISQKVLTSNLRQMEQDGLVTREVFNEVPPRVDYTLTDVGYSLASVLSCKASNTCLAAPLVLNTTNTCAHFSAISAANSAASSIPSKS